MNVMIQRIKKFMSDRVAQCKERAYTRGYSWASRDALRYKHTLKEVEALCFPPRGFATDFDRGATDAVRDLAKFDWVRPSR